MSQNEGERGHRVLVVEDDESIRESLRIILQDEGYQVDVAENGLAALDRLETEAPPALVIVDLVMPVMNGWELCAEMARREALAGLPVVIVSASGDIERSLVPSPLRTVHTLRKPIVFDRLLAHVARYCG
jgi:CheY-like chemotaxis protein